MLTVLTLLALFGSLALLTIWSSLVVESPATDFAEHYVHKQGRFVTGLQTFNSFLIVIGSLCGLFTGTTQFILVAYCILNLLIIGFELRRFTRTEN